MLGPSIEKQVILNAVDVQSMPHSMYGYPTAYGSERSIESVMR